MSDTEVAEAYIRKRYRLWRGLAVDFDYKRRKAARIAKVFEASGGTAELALELGVGPGGIAAELSRAGTRVVGVDLSPDALIQAQRHCRGAKVSLVRGSGFNLPFQDASIPLVYASQVLHLFDNPDRLKLMVEVHRVLKPGSRFVFDMKNILTHPKRYWASTRARRSRNFPRESEILNLIATAAFSEVRSYPGVLPGLGWRTIPNTSVFRLLSHTNFYVATKSRT